MPAHRSRRNDEHVLRTSLVVRRQMLRPVGGMQHVGGPGDDRTRIGVPRLGAVTSEDPSPVGLIAVDEVVLEQLVQAAVRMRLPMR